MVRPTSPLRGSLLLGTEPVWAAAVDIALAGTGRVARVRSTVLVLVGTGWGRSVAAAGADTAQTTRRPRFHTPETRGTPGR